MEVVGSNPIAPTNNQLESRELPPAACRYHAAPAEVGKYIVPASNFSDASPAPVGTYKGLGPYGTYDMAGNAKEWVMNGSTDGLHLLQGGGWKSQTYLYAELEALPSFDRSPSNGFRCVRNVEPVPVAATQAVHRSDRDFSKEKPVSDEVFRAYQAMYAYQKIPLNAKEEGVVGETADWREQRVSFETAYGDGRMAAYLFLPKHVKPPYQTVAFFPSARVVLDAPPNGALGDIEFFDYVVQSGRAVLYPVYQGTYERQVRVFLPGSDWSLELATQRFKDLAQSVDYLETRPDIDTSRMPYLGVSMGSAEGVDYATLLQDKFRAIVFLDGGFFLWRLPAGVDQKDFAPRTKKPVLMVNGRYDFSFSMAESQDPMFRMLGTAEADKRHVILESPHDVNNQRSQLVLEVLGWLDKYLGRVQ